MNTTQWWDLFNKNKNDMVNLILAYHPAAYQEHHMKISAPAAEYMCELIRNNIRKEKAEPIAIQVDKAIAFQDIDKLISLMNQAWFGMPESYEVRREPGFHVFCDLCEGIYDEENDNE